MWKGNKARTIAALLIGMVLLVAGIVKGGLFWQRSHFSCSGDMQVLWAGNNADISIQYVFDGDKGVAVLRGGIRPEQGEPVAINHNVWFSFSRNGDDFFLRSESVTFNSGGEAIPRLLSEALPEFYLHPNVSFYLNILRIDGSNRQFFTSRSPSVLCKS